MGPPRNPTSTGKNFKKSKPKRMASSTFQSKLMATRNPRSTHQLREVGSWSTIIYQGFQLIPGGRFYRFLKHQQSWSCFSFFFWRLSMMFEYQWITVDVLVLWSKKDLKSNYKNESVSDDKQTFFQKLRTCKFCPNSGSITQPRPLWVLQHQGRQPHHLLGTTGQPVRPGLVAATGEIICLGKMQSPNVAGSPIGLAAFEYGWLWGISFGGSPIGYEGSLSGFQVQGNVLRVLLCTLCNHTRWSRCKMYWRIVPQKICYRNNSQDTSELQWTSSKAKGIHFRIKQKT